MKPEREAILRACAAEGLSQTETARRIGVTPNIISLAARELSLVFWHGNKRRSPDEREAAMADLYRSGETLEAIGQKYGVTRERVRQIITKWFGIRRQNGGAHLQKVRRQAEREAKRDTKWFAKHGCTYAEWKTIPGKARAAFCQQRHNADVRKIGWELTLWQWWTLWRESGHWNNRGRGQGYGMCRKGDIGPYAIGNVFFAPCFINSSEKPNRKSPLPIGVSKRRGSFVAKRSIRGQMRYLGSFPTASQAAAAYWAAGATA